MRNKILLIIVCFISFFILIFRITEVPPGINGDEAGIAYNALLLSRNLRDETGKLLPIFVKPSNSDWKQPVTVYTTAVFFKIFGPSYKMLRMVSVFFALISIILAYKFTKSFWAIVLFVTTPIIMIQSHIAIENIALIPFILFWLYWLKKFEETKKNKYLVSSGISLGIGLFSYYGMRIIVPVLVVLTIVHLRKVRHVVSFLGGVVPFFGFLFLSKFFYPGAVVGNYTASLKVSPYDFLYRYLSGFDFSFLFFNGDATNYHSTGLFGMLLIAVLPLFIIGAINVWKSKNRLGRLVLLSFFLGPILYGFVPEIHRASRLMVLVPLFVIVATEGLMNINKFAKVFALVVIVLSFVSFAKDYWYEYPKRVTSSFGTPLHQAFELTRQNLQKTNYKVCIEDGIYKKEYPASEFFKETYIPKVNLEFCDLSKADLSKKIFIMNPSVIRPGTNKDLVPISPTIGFYKVFVRQ